MKLESLLNHPPEEAIALLKSKGYRISFDWREVWKQAHQDAFTVAKAMSMDVLEDIRAEVTLAMEEGIPLAEFQARLAPRLQARGWWGKREVTDPKSGKKKDAWLGTPWRLNTIYQTNLQTHYQCGRFRRMTRPALKNQKPYWQYIAVMDGSTRAAHRALHGKILRVDDRLWQTHYPPNGYNCRCTVRALSEADLKDAGLEVAAEPDGTVRHTFGPGEVETGEDLLKNAAIAEVPGQGWDHHPCEGWTPEEGRVADATTKAAAPVVRAMDAARETAEKRAEQARQEKLKALVEVRGKTRPPQAFADLVSEMVAALPNAAQNLLLDRGVQFVLGRTLPTIYPFLKNRRPPGYPKGTTASWAGGLYMPDAEEIALASHPAGRTPVEWLKSRNTLHHEVGHAVDFAARDAGGIGATHPDFIAAHKRDARRMSRAQRAEYAYYLQEGERGYAECFAETFSEVVKGVDRAQWERTRPPITEAFENVARLMREVYG